MAKVGAQGVPIGSVIIVLVASFSIVANLIMVVTEKAGEIAVLRSQETGLGVLVYSLVAILLWPINSRAAFSASARQLATARRIGSWGFPATSAAT